MKFVTEQDLRTVFPADLHYYERLNEGQARTYRYLTTLYRKLLNAYAAFMGVGKYDVALAENARAVVPVPRRDQDLYQRYANGPLQYFYVRNNIHVERLDRKELGFLRARLEEHDFQLDYDSLRFVEDSYPRVTRERGLAGAGQVYYGPERKRFLCPADALVVGCRVAEGQGRAVLEDVIRCDQLLQGALGARLNTSVAVVQYDADSVVGLEP